MFSFNLLKFNLLYLSNGDNESLHSISHLPLSRVPVTDHSAFSHGPPGHLLLLFLHVIVHSLPGLPMPALPAASASLLCIESAHLLFCHTLSMWQQLSQCTPYVWTPHRVKPTRLSFDVLTKLPGELHNIELYLMNF